MNDFTKKICLVAGNLGKFSKDQFKIGLGGVIAQHLVKDGALVIVSELDFDAAQNCADLLGDSCHAIECDFLKTRESTTRTFETDRGTKTEVVWVDNPALDLVNTIVKEYGHLDAVISNFDYFAKGKITKSDDALYEALRTQNAGPTFHLMAAVREQFSKQRKATGSFGKVVILTNIVGKSGMALGSLYSAFKGANIGLVKCLAREFARFANVNGIAHGPIGEKKAQGPKDRIKKNFLATKTELANAPLTFENIAPLVTYLASDEASAITGQVMNVDGGLWLKLEA
jgi:NAD(P)-dependent dehydrogenase (short-subunit alcohol dehydrogenase family)